VCSIIYSIHKKSYILCIILAIASSTCQSLFIYLIVLFNQVVYYTFFSKKKKKKLFTFSWNEGQRREYEWLNKKCSKISYRIVFKIAGEMKKKGVKVKAHETIYWRWTKISLSTEALVFVWRTQNALSAGTADNKLLKLYEHRSIH
jgi:hypothetical protein